MENFDKASEIDSLDRMILLAKKAKRLKKAADESLRELAEVEAEMRALSLRFERSPSPEDGGWGVK